MSNNNNNDDDDYDPRKKVRSSVLHEQKVEKNKQFSFGSELPDDQDVFKTGSTNNNYVAYENLVNGYGKIRKFEENIYENICEDCGRLYTTNCDFCASDDDDLLVKSSRKENKLYSKRKLQDFFGSFRLRNVFNSSPSHKRRKFTKCDIIHNVDDVFRTNQTFDLNAIDQMKKLRKYGKSDFFLARNLPKVTQIVKKAQSYSDNLNLKLFDSNSSLEKSENIYENLHFNKFDVIKSLINVNDDIIFYDSLHVWMMSLLSTSDDDYVNDVYYYVKSIPSKTFSDCSNLGGFQDKTQLTKETEKRNDAKLVDEFKSNYEDNLNNRRKQQSLEVPNFPQIQILYKNQSVEVIEDQSPCIVETEKSDFVAGLLDIFEEVLKREKANSKVVDENCGNCSSSTIAEISAKNDEPKLELMLTSSQNTTEESKRKKSLRKGIAGNNKRKFVIRNILLSISLNTIIIDYDQRLKLLITFSYFTSVSCGVIMRSSFEQFCYFLDKNYSVAVIPLEYRRKMLSEFVKRHGMIIKELEQKQSEIKNERNIDQRTPLEEKEPAKNEEIYQSIWTCKTEGEVPEEEEDVKEIKTEEVIDEQEWEMDEDFSFSTKPQSTFIPQQFEHLQSLKHPNDLYSDICILYNKKSPNQNRIIYDYDQNLIFNNLHGDILENSYAEDILPTTNNNNNINSSISYGNLNIPECVKHWQKFLLLDINYIDDEEDVIMTEKSIAGLERVESTNETLNEKDTSQRILELKNKFNNQSGNSSRNNSLKTPYTPKFIHESKNHVLDHGQDGSFTSFKSAESLSNLSIISDRSDEKGQKKRFRDHFKVKIKKEEKDVRDGPVFGAILDHLEMDEYEGIPKFVTECINVINEQENVTTHGIYRTSGNKMVIENLKKWIDEKKAAKKYEILKIQPDIHCVTGVLKLFFREMKYPLIPYEMFLNCTKNDDIPYIRDQIHSLDRTSFLLLKYLIKHLKLVELHCEDNKMNSSNLSIVWGGCLMSSMVTSCNSVDLISRSNEMNTLFNALIDNYELVFT